MGKRLRIKYVERDNISLLITSEMVASQSQSETTCSSCGGKIFVCFKMASCWMAGTSALGPRAIAITHNNFSIHMAAWLKPTAARFFSKSVTWLSFIWRVIHEHWSFWAKSWFLQGRTCQWTIALGCHCATFWALPHRFWLVGKHSLVWTHSDWLVNNHYHSSMLPWSTNWAGSDISGAEFRRCRLTPGGMSAAWVIIVILYVITSSSHGDFEYSRHCQHFLNIRHYRTSECYL